MKTNRTEGASGTGRNTSGSRTSFWTEGNLMDTPTLKTFLLSQRKAQAAYCLFACQWIPAPRKQGAWQGVLQSLSVISSFFEEKGRVQPWR